jgi:hypothetical protein
MLFPILGVALLVACGKTETLTVAPTTPAKPELVPSPQLQAYQYKRILLLPPADPIEKRNVDVKAVKDKNIDFYLGKLEKSMLVQGFDVISPEIVARAEKGLGAKARELSPVEKALILGKETQSDAVLVLQSLTVVGGEAFYAVENMKAARVPANHVKTRTKKRAIRKKGKYYHSESKDCLVRVPYYDVRIEAKLLDASSGSVLWVGSGTGTVLDALKGSWVAKVKEKKCRVVEENYDYEDLLEESETLDTTFSALLTRMLEPMKVAAFAGKPLPTDKPKPEKPPEKPPEPKAKMAIVSGEKAALRMGPSKKDRRIRYVPRKAEVEILETMGEWAKVKLQDGSMGWMHDSVFIIPK